MSTLPNVTAPVLCLNQAQERPGVLTAQYMMQSAFPPRGCNPLYLNKRRCISRCIQALLELIIQLKKSDGETFHVQRGHVIAYECLVDLDTLVSKNFMNMLIGNKEFHERRSAHAVHHNSHFISCIIDSFCKDLIQKLIRDLIDRTQFFAIYARLAVDALADLHLALGNLEQRLARAGELRELCRHRRPYPWSEHLQ